MAIFPSKKFRSASEANSDVAARYRAALSRRPFLYFGLPFMAIIVAGSFVLTPATAVRYEKYDRKVKQLSRDDELAVRKNPRKVDWRDEYQVSLALGLWSELGWVGRDVRFGYGNGYGLRANEGTEVEGRQGLG